MLMMIVVCRWSPILHIINPFCFDPLADRDPSCQRWWNIFCIIISYEYFQFHLKSTLLPWQSAVVSWHLQDTFNLLMDVHIVQRGSRTPITVLFRSVHCTLSKIIMIICKIIRKNYDILGRTSGSRIFPFCSENFDNGDRPKDLFCNSMYIMHIVSCVYCLVPRVFPQVVQHAKLCPA